MRASFLLLSGANVLILVVTFAIGMTLAPDMTDAPTAHTRHYLMGILAGLFTCFVQVVAFMYFVVCEKIVRQSVLSGQLGAEKVQASLRFKGRAIRLSMSGIGLILLTTLLGGTAIAGHSPRYHQITATATVGGLLFVFFRQYVLIDEGVRHFESAFAPDTRSSPAKP